MDLATGLVEKVERALISIPFIGVEVAPAKSAEAPTDLSEDQIGDGILASTLLETVYGGGLVRPGSPDDAASFAHSHGGNIASTISEVWNLHRNPIDAQQVAGVWLLKLPAALGLLIFVASSLVESRDRGAGTVHPTIHAS